jgi:hypothetical protein
MESLSAPELLLSRSRHVVGSPLTISDRG